MTPTTLYITWKYETAFPYLSAFNPANNTVDVVPIFDPRTKSTAANGLIMPLMADITAKDVDTELDWNNIVAMIPMNKDSSGFSIYL